MGVYPIYTIDSDFRYTVVVEQITDHSLYQAGDSSTELDDNT